jgi:hypothetical protein
VVDVDDPPGKVVEDLATVLVQPVETRNARHALEVAQQPVHGGRPGPGLAVDAVAAADDLPHVPTAEQLLVGH